MPKRNRGPHLHWRPDRHIWEIRWFDRGAKRSRSTGTEDRADAEAALAEFIIRRERKGPCHPAERPVADSLASYGEERADEVTDPARIGYAIDALLSFWGNRTVDDVRETTCKAYRRSRNAEGAQDGTIRRELGTLRAAINRDYKAGLLTETRYVWLPSPPDPKDRWLNRNEMARLLNAARSSSKARLYLPLFILIGLYTGARKEAILSLRWPQIDLDRQLIDFNPPGRRRTSKGRPVIRIPRRLMTFLRLARRRGHETGHVIHANGKPIKDLKKSFHQAAIKAGFITNVVAGKQPTRHPYRGRPFTPIIWQTDVSPHTLRHTAGTWMAQRGVPMWEIAGYLGHADSRTTERIYAHHSPDYLERARQAFD